MNTTKNMYIVPLLLCLWRYLFNNLLLKYYVVRIHCSSEIVVRIQKMILRFEKEMLVSHVCHCQHFLHISD